MKDIYPATTYALPVEEKALTVNQAIELIENIAKTNSIKTKGNLTKKSKAIWSQFGFGAFDANAPIKRGEFAVLVAAILDPFNSTGVTIPGEFIN